MASIHKEILINADPETIWTAIRNAGEVKKLFPGVLTDSRLDGDARVVTFANGTVLRELIVDVDDKAQRFVYASVGGRTTHHNSSLQVFPDSKNETRVVWITDLLPDELIASIRELVEQGAIAMKKSLER